MIDFLSEDRPQSKNTRKLSKLPSISLRLRDFAAPKMNFS